MTKRALEGIRVLDFGRFMAGAYATRWLADLGADVLKVEPPGGEFRDVNLVRAENGELVPQLHTSTPAIGGLHGGFLYSNAGKRGICINVKALGGLDLVRKLIAQADIVLESFTPHVFESWGLSYEEMRKIKPDIIFVQASGFGQDEPDPRAVCTAPVAHAMSGFTNSVGYRGDYPLENMFAIGDPVSATVTAFGMMAALVHKLRTGEGQHVDSAMVDSLAAMDSIGLPHAATSRGEYLPQRNGRSNPMAIPLGVFRVKDQYVCIQAGGSGDGPISGWRRICELMGKPELADDPEWATDDARRPKEDKVWEMIEAWLDANFDDAESAAAALQSRQILAAKVNSSVDILTNAHYVRRGMVVEVEHPLIGPLPTVATPNKYSATPTQVGPAPFLGQHNAEALHDWLGLGEADVRKLYDDGILEHDTLVDALRDSGELPDPWATATPQGDAHAHR